MRKAMCGRLEAMPQTSEPTPSADKNRHIREYLSYYISFPRSPYYAVLVNGPWGIGKTFLIKRLLKSLVGPDTKYVFVSLYGLATLDEIDDALLRAMYPALGWTSTKLVGRAAKAAMKFFKIDFELNPDDVLNKFDAELF